VCGVKELSPLCLPEAFDYVTNSVIDSMHHLYLHVVKEMVELWFGEEYQDTTMYPWSLYSQINQVDAVLCKIQIPHEKQEPPRSLRECHKWKGITI